MISKPSDPGLATLDLAYVEMVGGDVVNARRRAVKEDTGRPGSRSTSRARDGDPARGWKRSGRRHDWI